MFTTKKPTVSAINTLNFSLYRMASPDYITVADLKKYATKHFLASTRVGILLWQQKNNYELTIYTKPNRDDPEAKTETVCVENKHDSLVFTPTIPAEGIVIIKFLPYDNPQLYDFHKSITLNEITPALVPQNPCSSENFIFLNFLDNKEFSNEAKFYSINVAKIKTEFHQPLSYSFYEFKIWDTIDYLDKIKKNIETQLPKKKWLGSTTMILSAHGNSLNHLHLTGEIAGKYITWGMPALMSIINQFNFMSLRFFDLFSCKAGEVNELNTSFIAQFNQALLKNGYTHFSVSGSTKSACWNNEDSDKSFCQSPSTTSQYGFLTFRLTTFASLKNTEIYIKFFNLPDYSKIPKHRISTSELAIKALKTWAIQRIEESKITLEYEKTYHQLQNMWTQYERLNKAEEKMQPITTFQSKAPFHVALKDALSLFKRNRASIYSKHIISVTPPNFSLALKELNKAYQEYYQTIEEINELTKLHSRLIYQGLFKEKNSFLFQIIHQAKIGIKTPHETLIKVNAYETLHQSQISEEKAAALKRKL